MQVFCYDNVCASWSSKMRRCSTSCLTAELEACGWTVETAAHAQAALRAAARTSFDLAIVDLGLPDMPGAALLQRLHEITPQMRFIVCTGYSPGSPQRYALPRDVPVLAKPWSTEKLVATAKRIMARSPEPEAQVRLKPVFL